ncbi:hypothetical protein BH11GEM1_BH11GEM1_09310 [soil metagenome]
MRSSTRSFVIAVVVGAALVGCSSSESAKSTADSSTSASAPAAASGVVQPGPGGKIITVELITDATGNYFKPKDISARKGDLIRYTLGQGVHNVDFLPDSNPGKSGLPKASDMLQLPGQTFDVLVSWDAGRYYFQCDPHALLGMRGYVTVAP